MSAQYYFCYGEELDPEHRGILCRESGRDDPLTRVHRIGFLPDRDLVFRRPRRLEAGAAELTTFRRTGQLVQGVLFEVGDADLKTLDLWAGTSFDHSRRRQAEILLEEGVALSAHLLEPTPAPESRYQLPAPEQLQRLLRGYETHDLDEWMVLAAARDRPTRWWVDAIFVYGRCLRGEPDRSLLGVPESIRCSLLARVPGRILVDGSRARLHPGTAPGQWAHGEYLRLEDPGAALARLDQRFLDGELRRVLLQTDVGEQHIRTTWAYRRQRETGDGAALPDGDWRSYRGTRRRFLEQLAARHLAGVDPGRISELLGGAAAADPVQAVADRLASNELTELRLARASGRWSVELGEEGNGGS